MSRTSIIAAVACLLAANALAQTAPPPSGSPASAAAASQGERPQEARAGQFIAQMPNTSMRLSKLIGVDVIGLDHHKIGDIDEVLLDRDGKVEAVVIGVGGFLGVGEKNVALPFGMLLWNTGDVSRVASPSASTTAGNTATEAQAAAAGAERMPGANISNEVLSATAENRGGRVSPDSGEVRTETTGSTATVQVVARGGPERAIVRLTKQQLESAPGFRYAPEGADRAK